MYKIDILKALLIGLVILFFSFVFGTGYGGCEMKNSMRKEAVKNKVAVWESDESGNPKFIWKKID